MKTNHNFIKLAAIIFLLMITDSIWAQAGHMHRATRRRTAVVVSSATHAHDQEAAAAQQAAAQPAPAPAPAPAPTDKLPIGTISQTLPANCVTIPSGDAKFYQCGSNYYREAYQGTTLVYITTDPPK